MMFRAIAATFLLLCYIQDAEVAFSSFYPKLKPKNIKRDVIVTEDPLILTPYIENNQIEKAQSLAEVPSDVFKNVKSYSGFFTVDKAFDSNMFFWFFPAETNYKEAPVLLWLQGGPGASSLYAIFQENGPFNYNNSPDLELNPYSWNKEHSVLYIDNPVQTGYSFTNNGFAQNETKVGEDLYEAIRQFFLLFPDLQKNDFFITGESYAGKYVPAASYAIYTKNKEAELKINLKGMAIGNGLCDPVHQLVYSDYLYQIGLADSNEKEEIHHLEKEIIQYIHKEDFQKAFELFDDLLNGDLNGGNTLFKNITGFTSYYNYLQDHGSGESNLTDFLESEQVRKAIHVGNLKYNDGDDVEKKLVLDLMQSVAPWISELLSNIRVLFYNGQLDIIVAYPTTENFLKHLHFSAANEYKTARRQKWYVGDYLAGYVKQAGNLTEVLVRNAGHLVPGDQPKAALDLITRFTQNQLH
uniref:Carboxypeptidase n=1 Tax=Diabrotica virgifera virgifera TaxID=50390 RepID=A0A6P7GY03_DIAVI